jgi:hypothetical protein
MTRKRNIKTNGEKVSQLDDTGMPQNLDLRSASLSDISKILIYWRDEIEKITPIIQASRTVLQQSKDDYEARINWWEKEREIWKTYNTASKGPLIEIDAPSPLKNTVHKINLILDDLKVCTTELSRLSKVIPPSGHILKALNRHSDSLRELSPIGQKIQSLCHSIRAEFHNTSWWSNTIESFYIPLMEMVVVINGFRHIAKRVDDLYEPPEESKPDKDGTSTVLLKDVSSGNIGSPSNENIYIFQKNFCVLIQEGKSKPLMKIIRVGKTSSVLRALQEAPKEKWLSWNKLKSAHGFSKDNPKEFFCSQPKIISLLDLDQRPSKGNISDWKIRLKPDLYFKAE